MIIKKVLIEEHIKKKIFEKHGVNFREIKDGLLKGNLIIYKSKKERYIALTHHHRYITIIFEYIKNNANIITSYPSSEWQIRLYRKKN